MTVDLTKFPLSFPLIVYGSLRNFIDEGLQHWIRSAYRKVNILERKLRKIRLCKVIRTNIILPSVEDYVGVVFHLFPDIQYGGRHVVHRGPRCDGKDEKFRKYIGGRKQLDPDPVRKSQHIGRDV